MCARSDPSTDHGAGDVKRGVVTLVVVLQDCLCLAGIGDENSAEGSLQSVFDFVLHSDVSSENIVRGPLLSGGDSCGE